MKILIALVIIFAANQVSCFALLDYVSGKFKEVANTVAVTFNDLRHKVKNFLLNKVMYENDIPTIAEMEAGKREIKTYTSEVIKKEETVRPGYANTNSDPSVLMSTPQLATLHGKRIESHVVHTEDGYLLTLHRLMSPLRRDEAPANKTVLLHHGLLGSSVDWILLGPNKSLPYMLSNVGYDVWMANARGNYYSKGHTSYNVNSHEFWNFTWQEIGEHDLPACIEYIKVLKNTTEPINYVGHSIGTTALLVLLSSYPSYNSYFRIGIFLAPLAFMSNVEGPIRKLGFVASKPSEQLLELIGKKEFFPQRVVPHWLAEKYCRGPMMYCSNPLFFLAGNAPNYQNCTASFIARLLYHVPAGTSTNTILHYAQVASSGKFHRFSDGKSEFPLSKVTLPIALVSSNEDHLANIGDVLKLYFNIGTPIDNHVIRNKNMSHTDFVWGTDADALVFSRVMEYLEKGLNWNLTKNNEVNSTDIF